jgi:SWI/SNF-related matrix-associated actin-dependent regulator of chromatin subfamily A3
MSAKRRQEAIARFSVPLEDIGSPETIECSASQRPSKMRNASVVEPTFSDGNDDWDDDDSDFVVRDDTEDALNDDGCLSSKSKKNKGKGKAVQTNSPKFGPSDENPRVMLLSLKAVRWIVATLAKGADNST